MDNSFNRPFAGYTLAELRAAVAAGNGSDKMISEVARREAFGLVLLMAGHDRGGASSLLETAK